MKQRSEERNPAKGWHRSWRDFEEAVDTEYSKAVERDDHFGFLMQIQRSRDSTLTRLSEAFGVELQNDEDDGWVFRITRPFKDSCEESDARLFVDWWFVKNTALVRAFHVYQQVIVEPGEDRFAPAAEVAMRILKTLPHAIAGQLQDGIDDDAKANIIHSVAGYLATRLSLGRNKKLRQAVRFDGSAPLDGLLNRLPGPIFVAQAEHGRDKPSYKLVEDLATDVSRDLARENRHRGDVGLPDGKFHAPDSDDFLARELSQLLDESSRSLSKRQQEVFQLWREGLSGPTIAEKLGIDEKTVHVHQHRIRDKLHRRKDLRESS